MTKPSRAFTLVELAIVIAVIPLVGLALYTMVHHFSASGDNFTAVMNAEETGLRLRATWRADVLAARKITVRAHDEENQNMMIQGETPEGPWVMIYRLNRNGIERVDRSRDLGRGEAVKPPHPVLLACGATHLSFDRLGSGWRMNWTLEDSDGLRRRVWHQNALATPITPDPEVTP